MSRVSYLLVLLGLVTNNFYMTQSYTLTASVLTQLGYNNQSRYIEIADQGIDSIDPNAFNGYNKLTTFSIFSNSLTAFDIEIFNETVNIRSLYIQGRSLNKITNSKNIKLPSVTGFYLTSNITSLNKALFNAFPSLIVFSTVNGNGGGTKIIDVHAFESLVNLTELDLRFNLLTGFEYLQIPKNLRTLILGNNSMNYFALSRTILNSFNSLQILLESSSTFSYFKSI